MENNEKETKSELTPRQWSLYNLLKSDVSKWWTQEEICDNIKDYEYSDDERNHCIEIGDDQRKINESFITDNIIVTDKHCFKIANISEYKKYRAKLIQRIKNAVKQVESWDFKYDRDRQGKTLNSILEELKEENEQFHETFKEERTPELLICSAIKGVKVSTRVFINWRDKIAYVVSFKRYQQTYDTETYSWRATFELANGDVQTLSNLQEKSYQYSDYKENQNYKEFFIKQIM